MRDIVANLLNELRALHAIDVDAACRVLGAHIGTKNIGPFREDYDLVVPEPSPFDRPTFFFAPRSSAFALSLPLASSLELTLDDVVEPFLDDPFAMGIAHASTSNGPMILGSLYTFRLRAGELT